MREIKKINLNQIKGYIKGMALVSILLWTLLIIVFSLEKIFMVQSETFIDRFFAATTIVSLIENSGYWGQFFTEMLRTGISIWKILNITVIIFVVIISFVGIVLQLPNIKVKKNSEDKFINVLFKTIMSLIALGFVWLIFIGNSAFMFFLNSTNTISVIFIYLVFASTIIETLLYFIYLAGVLEQQKFGSVKYYSNILAKIVTTVGIIVASVQLFFVSIATIIFQILVAIVKSLEFDFVNLLNLDSVIEQIPNSGITFPVNLNVLTDFINGYVNQFVDDFIITNIASFVNGYLFEMIFILIITIILFVVIKKHVKKITNNVVNDLKEEKKSLIVTLILLLGTILFINIFSILMFAGIFTTLFSIIFVANGWMLFVNIKSSKK